MKTIEEKAKAYDEALERAKMSYHTGDYDKDALEMLEIIFPELKESEDERIRKLLIEAVIQVLQDQYCSNRGVSKEKVVAWLEKQGNNMGIPEATKQKLEDNLNKALEKETPESFNEFLDEQGEQKPIDLKTKAGNWYVCDMEVMNENMVTAFRRGEIYYCPKDGYLDVRGALFEVGCLDVFRLATEKEIPQPKQEWSEEDEQYLLVCKNALAKYQTTDKWDACIISHWLENKLKSLKDRYTWKPSDEQMITLRHVISGCSYDIEPLVELETKLKEL